MRLHLAEERSGARIPALGVRVHLLEVRGTMHQQHVGALGPRPPLFIAVQGVIEGRRYILAQVLKCYGLGPIATAPREHPAESCQYQEP